MVIKKLFIRYHGNHKSSFKLKILLFKVKSFDSFACILVQGLCYVKYDSGDFIHSVRNFWTLSFSPSRRGPRNGTVGISI